MLDCDFLSECKLVRRSSSIAAAAVVPQHLDRSNSTTAAVPPQHRHHRSSTAAASPQHRSISTATGPPWQQQCHRSSSTATAAPPQQQPCRRSSTIIAVVRPKNALRRLPAPTLSSIFACLSIDSTRNGKRQHSTPPCSVLTATSEYRLDVYFERTGHRQPAAAPPPLVGNHPSPQPPSRAPPHSPLIIRFRANPSRHHRQVGHKPQSPSLQMRIGHRSSRHHSSAYPRQRCHPSSRV